MWWLLVEWLLWTRAFNTVAENASSAYGWNLKHAEPMVACFLVAGQHGTNQSHVNLFVLLVLQLKWQLGSAVPGLGMLLRRYAPHDTYHIWKVGSCLRVDGTLMGIDTKSTSIIPEWKRGHFSLILDGTRCATSSSGGGGVAGDSAAAANGSAGGAKSSSGVSVGVEASTSEDGGGSGKASTGPKLLFLNHTKKTYIDLSSDKKVLKEGEQEMAQDEIKAALEK